MSDIWIVLVNDRHAGSDAYPYSSSELAIRQARCIASENASDQEDIQPNEELTKHQKEDGYILSIRYSIEDDWVAVLKRTMDDNS